MIKFGIKHINHIQGDSLIFFVSPGCPCYICRFYFQCVCQLGHCVLNWNISYILLVTSPRRALRGIVFTRSVCLSVCVSVCVSVCPANILVFYFSAIRRDIDMKCIQDTYRVVLN